MSFKNEGQLYRVFTKAIKELQVVVSDNPILKDLTQGEFTYLERKLNNQTLNLLVEQHYSRKPIDYVHKHLIPKIKQNPQTWFVLRESANEVITDPLDSPTDFYFQELGKLFSLPYEDALADLSSSDTRKYIKGKTRISDEDIDMVILTFCMKSLLPEDFEYPSQILKLMSETLQKPPQYTVRLLSRGPKTNLDFKEVIVKHWNDYSRKRFHKLLKQYSDRTNILVSVGYNHLPVFK